MEKKNKISLIFITSLILFSIKWIISIVNFPNEEITIKIISESLSDSYFHYVKVLSELNFNNDYSLNKNEFLLIVPIGSVIFHSIVHKLTGVYSFIILEFVFIYLFIFLFSSILNKFNLRKNISLLLAILLFSLPSIISLIGLNISLLDNLGKTFFNLKFPRPLVTNIYLFYFIYFLLNTYKKELLIKKNIYKLSIFFSLVLSSSFFIFVPLSILFLIFTVKKIKNEKIFYKIKLLKYHLLAAFLIFIFIGFFFIHLLISSNPDYASRMGIISLDNEKKFFLLKYYFFNIFKDNLLLLIIIPTVSFFFIKKFFINRYYFIVEVFFLNYVCSLFSPIIIILISNKIAFINHINNLLIINLFLYIFIIIVFFYKNLTDEKKYYETRKLTVNILIIILILLNSLNQIQLIDHSVKYTDYRSDKNEMIKKIRNINTNCKILTFDNSIMTYLILKDYKLIPYINGTFVDRKDLILENNLINSLKLLNINYTDFEKMLESNWDGWRLKNSRIQQLFWQKYQANSFYTFNQSKGFKMDDYVIIKKTRPSIVHQLVIPNYEKKRLLNKFLSYEISEIPDFIILDKNDSFWTDKNMKVDKFNVILNNNNFKIYQRKIISKC